MSTTALVERVIRECGTPALVGSPTEDISAIQRRLEGLKKAQVGLLPLEHDLQTALESAFERETRELKKLQCLMPLDEYHFPRLSLAPLRWRNNEGLPTFALFDLNYPDFQITVQQYNCDGPPEGSAPRRLRPDIGICWDVHPLHDIPCLKKRYKDVVCTLARRAGKVSWWQRSRMTKLRARFSGTVPQHVREKVRTVQKAELFSAIFFLQEIESWELTTTAIPKQDPLVLGYTKYDEKGLWLIDAFDVTPIEDYWRREFPG